MSFMNRMDIAQRKRKMKIQRRTILDREWSEYLKNNYPEWWEEKYGYLWDYNIIYYSPNGNIITYNFQDDPSIKMNEIIQKLYNFIIKQHMIIKLCFGEDIYNLVKIYLPGPFENEDNYLYIHQHIPLIENPSRLCFRRRDMLPFTPLNRIFSGCPYQLHSDINLRFRANKIPKTINSKKIFKYN